MEIRDSVKTQLIQKIKGDVFFDELTRRIYAYSASICYLMPAGVIYPLDTEDVIHAIRIASENGIPVTARGAGSGVAGQNLGKGIILDFSVYMKRILCLDREKLTVTVEPGLIRSTLNKYLFSHGLFYPPDPSSSDYASLGGMVANNSGGAHSLLYGTTKDYVKSLTLVSVEGEEMILTRDGAAPSKYEKPVLDLLREASPALRKNEPKSFRNSCGYNLFECQRQEDKTDFTRLICGSEGTLGIMTNIELDLRKLPEFRSSVLLCYKDAKKAISEVRHFLGFKPSTVQALAEEFLRIVEEEDPAKMGMLPKGTRFLLLAEFDGNDKQELDRRARGLIKRSSAFSYQYAENSSQLGWVWAIRKSAVAFLSCLPGNKPTRWIEDAAVPVDRLSDFVLGIEKLLKKYHFSAALFGHAGQGLLHFSPRLDRMSPDYQKWIEDLGHEHALFSRSLEGVPSGEHGDGLLRTPYMKEIWGEVYPYFEKLKKIFDPHFVLNPLCVVAERDYKVSDYLRYHEGYGHVKAGVLERFVDEIEACHGCGKCVDFCPVTLSQPGESGTSRSRMSLLREIISGHLKNPFARQDLLSFFNLCLHCKTCKKECPTHVDVAKLIEAYFEERYRLESPPFPEKILSKPRALGTLAVKIPAFSKKIVGSASMSRLSSAVGMANLRHMKFDPPGSRIKKNRSRQPEKNVTLFSGCVGDFFNSSEIKAALALLKKCGYDADILSGFCCGEPAFVRGLKPVGLKQLARSIHQIKAKSGADEPVIFTSPSCLLPFLEYSEEILGKQEAPRFKKNLHEACGFLEEGLMVSRSDANINLFRSNGLKLAIQIPCHLKMIGGDKKLVSFMSSLPVRKTRVLETNCCGFGGSRGFEKRWAQHAERIGLSLANEILAFKPHIVVSPCVTCRLQIRKLTGMDLTVSESEDLRKFIHSQEADHKSGDIQVVHPLVLAYEMLI